MTPQAKERIRRVARPWRVVFVLYALAMTVATHWPELRLGTATQPAPDKLIHMLAFGGLAVLLLRTRWLRSPWLIGLLALVWAALDELAQGLPILHRTASWQDMLAGQIGVVLALTWWWALGPVGQAGNRIRLAHQAFILGDLFLRLRTWIVTLAAAGTGAIIIGFVTWGLLRLILVFEHYDALSTLIAAAFAGAVAAGHVVLTAMCRRHAHALKLKQPCLECGRPCRDVAFDQFGRGRCPVCEAPVHRGQWSEPMDLPLSAALRGTGPAALVAIGLLFLAALMYGIVLGLSKQVTLAKELLHSWQSLSPDMQSTVDLAGIAFILAIAMRLYRWRQARLHDQQHVRCRGCNHDLRETPVEQGLGRCGECGMPFVRFPRQSAAVSHRS